MNLTKYIKVYKNAVPDVFCDKMIQKFEDNPKQYHYQKRANPVRNFKMSFNQIHISNEKNWKEEDKYLMDIFPMYVRQYREECNIIESQWPIEWGYEPIRFKRYLPNGNEFFTLPDCVTITVVAQQNYRELTIDFGTEGCEVRNNILKGKIILSYTRDPDAREILITKTLEDFYFNDKSIVGTKTILRERSNDNGNPQFTKTFDITVVWPDGAEASRTGTRIREWIEGHGSGVWSDNVFEVTGNWASTFRNGNTHSYEVVIPLRREVICRFFVSGLIDVQRTNFAGVFDYGNGDCDNQATFTFEDGTVRDITLR